MKRLVITVSAMEPDLADREGAHSDSPESPDPKQELRVEATVSNEQVQEILDLLVPLNLNISTEQLLDELIRLKLEAAANSSGSMIDQILSDVERRVILQVYEECNGVQTKAAERLGINRATLHKRLRDYESSPSGETESL